MLRKSGEDEATEKKLSYYLYAPDAPDQQVADCPLRRRVCFMQQALRARCVAVPTACPVLPQRACSSLQLRAPVPSMPSTPSLTTSCAQSLKRGREQRADPALAALLAADAEQAAGNGGRLNIVVVEVGLRSMLLERELVRCNLQMLSLPLGATRLKFRPFAPDCCIPHASPRLQDHDTNLARRPQPDCWVHAHEISLDCSLFSGSHSQDHDKNLADDPSQRLSKEERRRAAAQERRRLKLQAQQEAAAAAATGAATEGRVMTRSMRAAARLKKVGGRQKGVASCKWGRGGAGDDVEHASGGSPGGW